MIGIAVVLGLIASILFTYAAIADKEAPLANRITDLVLAIVLTFACVVLGDFL